MFKKIIYTGAFALLTSSAFAQETETTAPIAAEPAASVSDVANNSQFGDWLVQCEAITVSRNACSIVQELTLSENNALVARFVALSAEGGAAILLAQLPIGVYLPGGAVYRLADNEEEEQREMIWQRCLGDLCEAAVSLSAEEVGKFEESEAILFGYRAAADSDPIVVRVDTSSFAQAMTAITAKE